MNTDESKTNFFVKNLGIIITLITMIAGFISGYAVLQYRVGQIEKRIDLFQGSKVDVNAVVREVMLPELNSLRELMKTNNDNIRDSINALREDIRILKVSNRNLSVMSKNLETVQKKSIKK